MNEDLFHGFDKISAQTSAALFCANFAVIKRLRWEINQHKSDSPKPCSRMDLSVSKCYEDTASSNTSFKGLITDNDSGYISQNMESNSSVDTAVDNRRATSLKEAFVNEDTLLEKPPVCAKQNVQEDEYEEYGHLFYMSEVPGTPSLNSSCEKANLSGFEGDESVTSDVSGIIPVATPLVVYSNVLLESSSKEDANKDENALGHSKSLDISKLGNDSSKENDCNYVNTKGNYLNPINHLNESFCDKSLNSSIESESNMDCIQKRITDENMCNMSSFESFYSFVCNLYTRSDLTTGPFATKSINPNELQINPASSKQTPSKSPQNSYFELETKTNMVVTHTVTETAIKNHPESICNAKRKAPIEQKATHPLVPKRVEAEKTKKEKPPLSPELFSDEEPESTEMLSHSMRQIHKTCDQLYTTKNDRKLLKRVQEYLGGVPPPPSVTIMQMTANEMLQKISDNTHLFAGSSDKCVSNILDVNNADNCANHEQLERVNDDKPCGNEGKVHSKDEETNLVEKKESLLITCRKGDINVEWPEIMQRRYHGLHYNRSKLSEEFEHLCLKYAQRYIGAETQSSCTVFKLEAGSPSKRKFKLKRPTKSPGKRLSYLAKRRITFTKDSLHAGPSSCSFIGSRTRQIMVDARRVELLSRRKSPRKRSPRKTPNKSPRRKTPSSSAKKRFAMRLKRYNTEESLDSISSASSSSRASVTKRALFQSPPDKGETSNGLLRLLGANTSDSDISESSRRPTPRRALFTSPPFKASPSKMSVSSLYTSKRRVTPKKALFKSSGKSSPSHTEVCDKKRKRTDTDDTHPNKIARSSSLNANNSSNESKPRTLARSQSSSTLQSHDMAEHRKKKLMWAVAEALRTQNIDMKHTQFKVFASVLARIIRHFLPNLFTNGPRPEGSTSESMLRIAQRHVFAVTRGKTVDQVIREAGQNSKPKVVRPSGYVGLDRLERLDVSQARNKENVLQDRANIISSRWGSETGASKNRRGENVERIRRVINFGDEDDNPGIR